MDHKITENNRAMHLQKTAGGIQYLPFWHLYQTFLSKANANIIHIPGASPVQLKMIDTYGNKIIPRARREQKYKHLSKYHIFGDKLYKG